MNDFALPLSLLAILALAVHQDLLRHRVSNLLTIGALTAGIGIHWFTHGGDGALHALAGAGVGLFCLLPLYALKGMGAGDVKLMAAAGAFLGPVDTFVAVPMSLVAGALLAVVVVVSRVASSMGVAAISATAVDGAQKQQSGIARATAGKFPYAAAIAAGVFATMWLRGHLDPLAGVLS